MSLFFLNQWNDLPLSINLRNLFFAVNSFFPLFKVPPTLLNDAIKWRQVKWRYTFDMENLEFFLTNDVSKWTVGGAQIFSWYIFDGPPGDCWWNFLVIQIALRFPSRWELIKFELERNICGKYLRLYVCNMNIEQTIKLRGLALANLQLIRNAWHTIFIYRWRLRIM